MKQLFFDDEKLFGRENVIREYVSPELAATYSDGTFSTDYNVVYVFRTNDMAYKMIYYKVVGMLQQRIPELLMGTFFPP